MPKWICPYCDLSWHPHPPSFVGFLRGVNPIDIFKNNGPIDMKIFWEGLYEFVVQKKFSGSPEYSTAVEYSMKIELFEKLAIFAILGIFHQNLRIFKPKLGYFTRKKC